MTLYTIALAGKAYFTRKNFLGKILQTTNDVSRAAHLQRVSGIGSGVKNLLALKSLPFPHNISSIPGIKQTRSGNQSNFPGIRNNFKSLCSAIDHATIRLAEIVKNIQSTVSDTVYLTTGLDVIVSKTHIGKGNIKLMPVFLFAR